MSEKSNDPIAIWQTMIGEMEKGFNAFADRATASSEFGKAGGAAAGAQQRLDLMEKYLVNTEHAEPVADGRHCRPAAVDRGPARRDQDAAAADAKDRGYARGRLKGHAEAAAQQASAGRAKNRNERGSPGLDLA